MATIEIELESAVGPRVMVWGEADESEIESWVPEGYTVSWETVPSPLDTTRDGQRGYSHPLVRNQDGLVGSGSGGGR